MMMMMMMMMMMINHINDNFLAIGIFSYTKKVQMHISGTSFTCT